MRMHAGCTGDAACCQLMPGCNSLRVLQSRHCTKHAHDGIIAGVNALLQIQAILQRSDGTFV
jgi:hypothetical protein